MTRVRYCLVILLIVMMSACSQTGPGSASKPLPDNPENRLVVAKRFINIMPPKEMLHGMATRVVQNLPEKDRKVFLEVMSSKNMEEAANRITLNALVKNFTVGELNAMVAFYGSPEGQSAYKKFAHYMGEMMPQIQQEVKKEMAEAEKQQAPQEPQKPKEQVKTPGQKDETKPPGKK
jgi:hypothetical protein